MWSGGRIRTGVSVLRTAREPSRPIPVPVVACVAIVAGFRGFAATAPPGWVGAGPATGPSLLSQLGDLNPQYPCHGVSRLGAPGRGLPSALREDRVPVPGFEPGTSRP